MASPQCRRTTANSIENRRVSDTAFGRVLGRLADGEEINGHQIEGLRTEASFFFDHEVAYEGCIRTPVTQLNQSHITLIDSVNILFEGQADLALAGVEGKVPWLQVVDLKTSGARENALEDHPLYESLTEPCLLYTSPSPRDRG